MTLDRLAKKLRARRMKGGSVKFESEELHFDIDEHGKPIRCYFKRSKDANKLIEEFMLLANKTVAESIGKTTKGKKAKTLPYRVHDNPDPQKFENLREFTAKFGYKLKSSSTKGATARALNKLMDEVQGKREEKVIQTIALRSMMKAKYTTHNIGHFGLLLIIIHTSLRLSDVTLTRWFIVLLHAISMEVARQTRNITKNFANIALIWSSLHRVQNVIP